jgi:hypothetical protein
MGSAGARAPHGAGGAGTRLTRAHGREMAAPPATGATTGPQGALATHAYAGVGSRQTPRDVLAVMEALAGQLAASGWVLRTGLSRGADQAFYCGAVTAGGRVELYLPWPGFEAGARLQGDERTVRVTEWPSAAACELAARHQAGWHRLSREQRLLLARDAHQVLGADLRSHARLVACWTADGGLDGQGLYEDGTGQALRIAHDHGVPVFNLARPEHLQELVSV